MKERVSDRRNDSCPRREGGIGLINILSWYIFVLHYCDKQSV